MIDTTALDKILKGYLEENGFDCEVEIDTDFAYSEAENAIFYSLVVDEKCSEYFLDFAKILGFNIDCGYFILAFFHELGHSETLCTFSEEELNEDDKIKEDLDGNIMEDCYNYFCLPVELAATEWAIKYITNNLEKVKKFAADVQNEVLNLIEKYQIIA